MLKGPPRPCSLLGEKRTTVSQTLYCVFLHSDTRCPWGRSGNNTERQRERHRKRKRKKEIKKNEGRRRKKEKDNKRQRQRGGEKRMSVH
jgi:hypothetical protein